MSQTNPWLHSNVAIASMIGCWMCGLGETLKAIYSILCPAVCGLQLLPWHRTNVVYIF
jgi:hypothetical protein